MNRRHAAPRTAHRRGGIVAAVLVVTMVMVGAIAWVASGAASVQLYVNSLDQTADANPGDGICATAAGTCTLRAAIQESNALNRAPGEVAIGVDPGFAGGRIDLVGTTSTWMRTTAVSTGGSIGGDNGAVFEITAPVDIDLEHKITAAPVSTLDGPGAAVFHINGSSITLTGIDDSWSGETTFYVGPNASNVTITGGTIATSNYYPERLIVVRGGASNITLSDYTVSGFGSNGTEWGWGFVDGATVNAVNGLTIDGVTYNSQLAGVCNASGAAGCSSAIISLADQRVTTLNLTNNRVVNFGRALDPGNRLVNLRSATVTNLNFTGNQVENPRVRNGYSLIDMGVAGAGASITNFQITDNSFTSVTADSEEMNGMIRMPANLSLGGSGLIARNVMHSIGAQMQAIYWDGPYTDAVNVSSSGLVIEENDFDGWGYDIYRSTIRMYQTGSVTIRHNTFGTATDTRANTVQEEQTGSGSYLSTMVNNWSFGANGKMNTWFPTARTAANAQAAPLTAQACTVELEVSPPTTGNNMLAGARNPGTPATLDVYWTAGNTAEVYLESVEMTSATTQTISVDLPLSDDPRLAHLPSGATVPVNPATGAVAGGLRVQTQDATAGATTASSQFSRVAAIGGTCQPELTIDQASSQNDPTVARDLHYTITSTIGLDPASLTPSDVTVAAAATADTIDAGRLNPRVVSVTEESGSNATVFDVVVRVDDSALVTATVAANVVSTPDGMTNGSAATSTDNQITFVNPLVVMPERFSLVMGEPNGKDYTISTRTGAPTPSADLDFTADVDAVGVGLGVTVSTTTPVIAAGANTTGPITVLAAEGEVTANTAVLVVHTVTSTDSNYDGLVVAPARAFLFSTDPTLQITKQAYTDVTDHSSPAQIQATGTEALSGAQLLDGEPVCFVYTITNTSADDWATTLTNVEVTDTDTRLGTDGLIGTIASLGIGQTVQMSACAVLIPVDTTAGGTP